jgi:NAD+ synthase
VSNVKIVDDIVEWMAEQGALSGTKGGVFGLSGGLDSAVVGALCKRAFADGTLGVIMPCLSQSCDMDDALLAAKAFGIETLTVDISGVLETLLDALPAGRESAVANLKPRLRMTALYYVANDRGMMVVGTSNKSERSVGYFTKYGDGGADICPLADIYKTDLYQIAAFLGVPQRITARPPSAGLWEGQTDEGELGISYRDLDTILKDLEAGRTPTLEPALVARVQQLLRSSAHKRASIPVFDAGGYRAGGTTEEG